MSKNPANKGARKRGFGPKWKLQTGPNIAETVARLRAVHKIHTLDAIQVATAIAMKADFFLTNDFNLSVIQAPTVPVLEKP